MSIKGSAHVYGDDINTDVIIPGKYTKTLNMQDLAVHCLEDLDPDFVKKVQKGDILVAGRNFGCGSSREQAPLALQTAGVSAVLASSFARVFFRNAINLGLPLIICDTSSIKTGDQISIDLELGEVLVNDADKITFSPLPSIMQEILIEGGLVKYLRKNGDFILK